MGLEGNLALSDINSFPLEPGTSRDLAHDQLADVPMVPMLPIITVPEVTALLEATLCKDLAERVSREMHKAVVGQDELVEMMLVAILSGGHILLEGVPGTAKTLSVRALARIFSVSFSRIQFTPDLMPSDIVGTSVFDPRTQEFHFRHGPIFAGLVLADEINRTPPKTQSALLEAMEERRVTMDGVSHTLPDPFLVCATQNPIEYEGTYPLPEAQLDRFMLKISVNYPSADEELNLLDRVRLGFRAQNLDTASLEPALGAGEMDVYRAEIDKVRIESSVQRYIVQICRATRENRHVALGASPRAAITLLLTSRALAAVRGRDFVTPDDVKKMCGPVLLHRLMIRPDSEIEGFSAERVLDAVLQSVEVPR